MFPPGTLAATLQTLLYGVYGSSTSRNDLPFCLTTPTCVKSAASYSLDVGAYISVRDNVAGWLSHHKKRIGIIAVGHSAKQIEEILFDWLLYGSVAAWATVTWGVYWGSVVTFAIMMPLSAIMCMLYIRLYDWSKKDWFGFELMKEWRDETKHETWFGRTLHRITRNGGIPAFLILSIHGDPFFTTVYFRHKNSQYHGLTKRDWGIFGASVLVSNAYWTIRWTVVVQILFFILLWTRNIVPI